MSAQNWANKRKNIENVAEYNAICERSENQLSCAAQHVRMLTLRMQFKAHTAVAAVCVLCANE